MYFLQVISEFIIAYRKASAELLAQGLADTDQQVIASMYTPDMASNQKVDVMTYACPRGSFGLFGYAYLYFCLPYICRASAECNSGSSSSLQFKTEYLESNAKIDNVIKVHWFSWFSYLMLSVPTPCLLKFCALITISHQC